MSALEQRRRCFLLSLGGRGISPALKPGTAAAQAATPQGCVLGAGEGEHLIHFRDHGNIFIKFGVPTGSANVAMGTQQVTLGPGIPIHRHWRSDEAFYILQGAGTVTLNDVPHAFEQGTRIFIPKNSWHGFQNPGHELLLLWKVMPAGLDGFFRDTCTPLRVPTRQLTR